MRTKGYKCYNVKCESCICKTLCGEPEDAALGCASRVVNVQTNADRIRAMSDEELVALLCISGWRMAECAECLQWLQQPVAEGTV